MDSITHIKDLINSFSKTSFLFCQFIEPLFILKNISSDISYKLNNDDFIYHLNEASKHIESLNAYLKDNVNPMLKKEVKKLKHSSNKDSTIPYADFKIDEPPLFSNPKVSEQLSFENIIKDNHISPVRRRSDNFSFEGTCPYCGAPKEYIYDNNKGKGQFQCKACRNTFTVKTTVSGDVGIYCPHCKCKLDKKHDRKGYIVYICNNKKCSYFQHNKDLVKQASGEHLKTSSGEYRLHYHYREFRFNLNELKSNTSNTDTKVSLSRIHFDERVLGLVLTYYVNYGLGSRKTALILKQVHGVNISHQTVINYASTVSSLVKDMVDNYPYKLGNVLCGDETYIKVRGKNHYVFFWSDPKSKIITSYTIYPTRDTKNACQSIHDSLKHYHGNIPADLTLITDANPIYNAAQLFFDINNIKFELHQVIGVKNKDDESKKYRPFKQIEERLNRTYKQNYYGTNGYDKLEGANTYMVLFVCFFNFLRQHSSLGYKTPVDDNQPDHNMLMPDQWLKLIKVSHKYHTEMSD